MTSETSEKLRLRTDILARRRELSTASLEAAAERLAEHLFGQLCEVGLVCAYAPIGAEPGSLTLLDRLRVSGVGVLLPVLCPDGDLDWAAYGGAESLAVAARGLREPRGRRLGPDAIADADAVLVPAVAVDRAGHRLGRGGGSYDRALARVRSGVPVVALLHDGEFVDAVPVQPHDRSVTHVVTPELGCCPVGDSSTESSPERVAERG